jgi:hypothetical protein
MISRHFPAELVIFLPESNNLIWRITCKNGLFRTIPDSFLRKLEDRFAGPDELMNFIANSHSYMRFSRKRSLPLSSDRK